MAGAAAVARSNLRRSKGKGNRRPKSKSARSSTASSSSVGGYAGGSFDNKSLGK